MAGLSKNSRTPRLLKTVNNKAYATAEDHEEQLLTLTTKKKNDDPNREPDSSGDDELPQPVPTVKLNQLKSAGEKRSSRSDTSQKLKEKRTPQPEDTGRGSRVFPGPQADNDVFAENERDSKRRKITEFSKRNSAPVKYGKRAGQQALKSVTKGKDNKAPGFQKLKGVDQEQRKAQRPQFKHVDGVPAQQRSFPSPSDVPSATVSSLECAELDIDDVELLHDSAGPNGELVDRCDSCHAEVDAMTKENFQMENDLGRKWTYRWQLRFCEYHKRHDAERMWAENKYPDIDWIKLPGRLRTADRTARIRRILSGEQRSEFQEDQERAVKSGKNTAKQFLGADTDKESGRTGAGYYGYRGETLLIEHIMQQFGDDLRARSTRDKAIAASGLAGGISGYVSAVLVPELAATLVAEDLKCDQDRAIEIVRDSSDLGDLLHPEQDDKTRADVVEVDD